MLAADKWTVARTLDEIGQYIALNDPNRFKSRAFERAARAVEGIEGDIGDLIESGNLLATSGIGKSIGPIIEEIARTGKASYLDELRKQYPPGIFDLLKVQGLGLSKIGALYSSLGIGSLDDLETAAREGRLAKLRGFGAKTQTKILEGIEKARKRESLYLLPTGLEVAEWIRQRLTAVDAIEDAEITGSVRRRLEVVRNVNVAIATKDFAAVQKALGKIVDRLEEVDDSTLKGVARREMDVLFHLAKPKDFGAVVLRSTGNAEFVEAFFEKAGAVSGRREEDVFENADIPFVEPERRESPDDLKRKKRIRLIEPTDIRGTFHVHTTFSDGRNTVREMLGASRDRGFDYVGLSDHSKAAYYAGGLTEARLREQHKEIDVHEADMKPMRVFRGSEADILPDGTIDYSQETLDMFDFVVASIHSRFNMDRDEMTERVLLALDDPHVTFIGHLTGRRLLSRDGYSVDFDRIFDKAAERGVMIEVNGNPQRLDVDWRHLPRAVDRGVLLSIHPDAHSINELSHVISGTWVGRKAGLPPKAFFNTKPLDEVEELLMRRKKKARQATVSS
jgi:DNA polymerase (family 10)